MAIKVNKFNLPQLFALCVSGIVFCLPAVADPVWHCSRTDVQVANASDNFTLAALGAEREVMHISLKDLYEIYQGGSIKAGGTQVSACFVGGNHPATQKAMYSIGADPKVLERLSSTASIVQSHLYQVHDEKDMLTCMTKHTPAIGYFSKPLHNEAVGPCF